MQRTRPRVLVLAEEKGLAEAIHRGLAGLPGLEPEVEVLFEPAAALREMEDRRYDLLVLGSEGGPDPERFFSGRILPGVPLVAVGGPPNGRDCPRGALSRVPLPLSFNLLREAVLDALRGGEARKAEELRRRGSAG